MATRHPQFGTLLPQQGRSNQTRTVWLAMFFLFSLFGKPFATDGFLQNELPQFILLRAAHPQLQRSSNVQTKPTEQSGWPCSFFYPSSESGAPVT
jgi:hypothetical protein